MSAVTRYGGLHGIVQLIVRGAAVHFCTLAGVGASVGDSVTVQITLFCIGALRFSPRIGYFSLGFSILCVRPRWKPNEGCVRLCFSSRYWTWRSVIKLYYLYIVFTARWLESNTFCFTHRSPFCISSENNKDSLQIKVRAKRLWQRCWCRCLLFHIHCISIRACTISVQCYDPFAYAAVCSWSFSFVTSSIAP